ncbi:hypothetical protein GXW82_10915 [Streptacidiphilus sp. 4-A2]|nr:hypothetical protein [Streptacidiphilus sp. 4-A2]
MSGERRSFSSSRGSGNVCPGDGFATPLVGGVPAPPDDPAADHASLLDYRLREGSHTDPDGDLIRFGSPMEQ